EGGGRFYSVPPRLRRGPTAKRGGGAKVSPGRGDPLLADLQASNHRDFTSSSASRTRSLATTGSSSSRRASRPGSSQRSSRRTSGLGRRAATPRRRMRGGGAAAVVPELNEEHGSGAGRGVGREGRPFTGFSGG